jgi:hypothetical protein
MNPEDEFKLFGNYAENTPSEKLNENLARCLGLALLFCRVLQARGDRAPFDPDAFQTWLESTVEGKH